jgi:hypothetical protein
VKLLGVRTDVVIGGDSRYRTRKGLIVGHYHHRALRVLEELMAGAPEL